MVLEVVLESVERDGTMALFRQAEWNRECVSPLVMVDPVMAVRVSDGAALVTAFAALVMSIADPTMTFSSSLF